MPGPVLVTGAAGFVGSHLLELLRPGGDEIVAWYRPDAGPTFDVPGTSWQSVDLLDRHAVARAMAGIGPAAVYHLAGAAHVGGSWQNPIDALQGNALATHHLFEALRAARLRPRVLVTCSATVYLPQERPIRESDPLGPSSPYATSKLAQEMLAARAWELDGVPAVIARAFNHTGPRQDASFVASGIARQIAVIEAGRLEPVLAVGNLDPRRDLTDVRDTVRAYAAMMQRARPGLPYNVCSGRGLAIRELVDALLARAQTPIRVVQDPARLRPNDTPVLVGSHERLSADTGWSPQIPIEQTVDDLLDYWRRRVAGE